MQLGGFGLIKEYDKIREAGFDYAELDMPEIMALDREQFASFKSHVEEAGFPVPVGTRVLPATEPLFFVPGYHEISLRPYLEFSCRRAGEIGIETILLGNGKARWLVDEGSLKKEHVFIGFLRMLCEIAGEQGQKVLIEPLGPKYSNYINTLPEADRVIRKAAMPNLFAMVDLRHFVWAKEPLEDIVRYREIVQHVHVDYPLSYPERKWPDVKDDYDYMPFFEQLKWYDGRLTVEADIPTDWDSAGKEAKNLLQAYRSLT